jgi:hypothetical protein
VLRRRIDIAGGQAIDMPMSVVGGLERAIIVDISCRVAGLAWPAQPADGGQGHRPHSLDPRLLREGMGRSLPPDGVEGCAHPNIIRVIVPCRIGISKIGGSNFGAVVISRDRGL